jgi:Tol biopolymer transport system component/DNA-binding winged helix-turn-helix (wHTH) protein
MAEPVKSADSIHFGQFQLSAETGELRKDGVRLKLAGQAIQVLAMLAASPGNLVSREELQHKLWPGASFGDPEHGLNAAVNRLRETLGDSAIEPKYIETVPGRGYRFIAALDLPVLPREPRPPELEAEPLKPPWWKRKRAIAVAACLVIAGLLYPWTARQIEWLLRQKELKQLTAVPLTALPGIVGSPSFSPDGSQIAFVWHDKTYAEGFHLYVKVLGNDKPLRITDDPVGILWAAWSPDGKSIAICRPAPSGDTAVFLISPLGGPERKITSANCFTQFGSILSWSPDGKQLAFLSHPADSPSDVTVRLYVLSLASMEEVPVQTNCNVVLTPAFSPRGDYLAWACADKLTAVSIEVQRLIDGKVSQLVHGVNGIGGLAWSGDARRIVFSSGFTGGDLWEVSLARPNRPEKLPFGHDATDVAISPVANRLALKQNHMNTNIWRVDLSDPQAKAQKIVVSSREQISPNYSPDGTQIAFSSNRSGSFEVWVADADGSNAVQLTSFGTLSGTARWSPDGKRIAFNSFAEGKSDIYLVDPHGGVPRKLELDVGGSELASWSHDGKWIYFINGNDSDKSTLWKVSSGGGHAVQVTKRAASWPLESPDGKHLYFSRDGWIWRVRSDGTEEEQVEGMPQVPGCDDRWYPFGSGIYFLAYANGKAEINFFDVDTKERKTVFALDKYPPEYMGGINVSRDGRWLVFAQLDEFSSDIMMVENWQ